MYLNKYKCVLLFLSVLYLSVLGDLSCTGNSTKTEVDWNRILAIIDQDTIFVDDFMSGPPNGVHLPSVNRAVYNFLLKNHLVFERWHKDGKGIANIKRPNSVLKRFQTLVIVMYIILLRKIKIIYSIIKCFPTLIVRHFWRR